MLREEEQSPTETPAPGPALGTAPPPNFQATPEVFQSMVSSLPDELKGTPFVQNTKDFQSLVEQSINAQKLIGKKTLEQPQENWTDAEWGKLYDQLGRPEAPEKYFEDIDGLNKGLKEKFGEDLPDIDAEELGAWAQEFHKAGMNSKAANQLIEKYVEMRSASMREINTQIDTAVAAHLGKLRQEWGDDYNANIDMSNQAFDQLAPNELKAFVAENKTLANNAGFLKLFQTLGMELAGGHQGDTGRNTPGFIPNSPASAAAELANLKETHRSLIHSDPNSLSMAERSKRDAVLQRINKLYEMKYPEES